MQIVEKDMGPRVEFATHIEDLSHTSTVYNVMSSNNHCIMMPWWHEILIFVLL
jgi:hypothetical protein